MKVGIFVGKIGIVTSNKQLVKAISQEDIRYLEDLTEQLSSWIEILEIIKDFFSEEDYPLNKKKIIKKYYAYSHVHRIFLEITLRQL
ncbi:hypothetical protein R4Y62_002564, partial [Enterococcus faecalis]|nr:hypothetical protein [Enterococcus faecalis]